MFEVLLELDFFTQIAGLIIGVSLLQGICLSFYVSISLNLATPLFEAFKATNLDFVYIKFFLYFLKLIEFKPNAHCNKVRHQLANFSARLSVYGATPLF